MGCCYSVEKTSKPTSPGETVLQPMHKGGRKEDKIEIAFKAKRANIFTEGVNLKKNVNMTLKKIPKTPAQKKLITTSIQSNYVFAHLSKEDIETLINSMEILDVSAGESIIKQGEEGDYFYVIYQGAFNVFVNSSPTPVASLGVGASFGELALIYHSPRQATVTASTESTLFSIDRDTFRYILAHSSSNRTEEVKKALSRVPLLSDLTDSQLNKLSDSVEVFHYNSSDVIIKKGEEGKIFYIIKEGVVTVTELGEKFNDQTLTAGDYFGERALLTGEPRGATVIAQTSVKVMALDRENFDQILGPLRDIIDHNSNLRILNSIRLFEKLSHNERKKLSQSFEIEVFDSGVPIIKEGEHGDKFYIIKDGEAHVVVDGREVASLKTGNFFGEMALMDDELRKATVISGSSTTPGSSGCTCFVLNRENFQRIVNSLSHVMNKETQQRIEEITEVTGSNPMTGGIAQSILSEYRTNYKLSDLTKIAVLGSGTFGRVTLVQETKSKKVYALKTMLKGEIVAHKQQANVLNEKNIMINSNHPFILNLFQTFKDSKKLYMLLEFIQGGELFSILHTNESDGIPESSAKFYMAGIIQAIHYLHSKDIAYRDMKPENCLVDVNGYPKLVDFGFAKVITGKSYTLCGTPEYLAPELVLARGHNKSVDYWACGILIYEMIAGLSPFADPNGNMDQVVICKNIVNGKLNFSQVFSSEAKDIIKKLLSREIQTRLGNLKGGVDDIKKHKWFSSLDLEQIYHKKVPAPWVPKVKSITDTSNFDPYDCDDHVDDGYVDHGNWDKDF